jgi:hypothetical protein
MKLAQGAMADNDLVAVDSPSHLVVTTWINDLAEVVGQLSIDKSPASARP